MMRVMAHRGPDDEGFESLPMGSHEAAGVAAFGFRRLAILDLTEAGHQPMVDGRTGNCLVFNGEIFNFRWLRARLQTEGVVFTSTGDSEVLLKALSMWGEAAIDMLDGMFALAFYEARSRRVLLARDALGIKPLYVAESPYGLFFASEVRTILASGCVSDEYDPAGLASYFAYGAPQDPLTIHRAISSFPCGASQWVCLGDDGRPRRENARRYWRFPASQPARSEEQAHESLKRTLTATVREHLAADVPIAFFLSGGIDSGLLTAIATRELGSVSTYSVGFESTAAVSELPVAAATARLLGTDHHEVFIADTDIPLIWEGWMNASDRPSIDGLNTFLVTGAVKRGNAKVAFSGLGADEVFGGYPSFGRIPRLARFLRPFAMAPTRVRSSLMTMALPAFPRRWHSRLLRLASSSGRPIDLAIETRRMLDEESLRRLGLVAGDLGLREDYLPTALYDEFASGADDLFSTVRQVETMSYMSNTLLRDSDINSMAHSIELRVPFVSRFLMDEAARSPGSMHLQGGVPKALLRKVATDYLPAEVMNRPKTGFSLPVGDWMNGVMRDACESAVEALQKVPCLDTDAVKRLWKRFEVERHHTHWTRPMLLVALGSYVDRQSRTYADNAGAVKVRPAGRLNATNSV